MNFLDFKFDKRIEENLNALEKQNRLPHAIIISGGSPAMRDNLSVMLSMWAVCKNHDDKPCGKCNGCIKARDKVHSDVYFAKGSGKTDGFNVDEMRKISNDVVIKPNEANTKVYIFTDADVRMSTISQNTFLKTLEEPPKNVLFILTCDNAGALLETILSRATVFSLVSDETVDEEILELAKQITKGILSPYEIDLLYACGKLNQRQKALDTLPIVTKLIRNALAYSVGVENIENKESAVNLARRLTKGKLLKLIDICEQAVTKIYGNINLNLLATWLCKELRRITWQK